MNTEKKKLPEQVLMKDPIGLNFDPRLCEEYFKQYKAEDQKSLVLQFCEMIIFHSLILLLNSKQPIDAQDKKIYFDEFRRLIEQDFTGKGNLVKFSTEPKSQHDASRPLLKSKLPPFFCLDIFFKYRMYDEACEFLYYRGEHNELLQLIRWEFEQMREKCEQKKKRLAKMQEEAKEASHEY
jgi:hypothetical protein